MTDSVAVPKHWQASGVRERICAGSFGNLSVAVSRIPLKGIAVNDEILLFTLPQGVTVYGIRFFSADNLSNICINGNHKLCNDITAKAEGDMHYTAPYTTKGTQEDITVKFNTASTVESDELIAILEYVFEGAS